MEFYEQMAATALRLLARLGASVTLPRTTGGSIDPVTGVVTPGAAANATATGIVKPYPMKLIDGTRIKATDRMLILSNEAVPVIGDKPTFSGSAIGTIESVVTSSPAGTPICYFCQVRQ